MRVRFRCGAARPFASPRAGGSGNVRRRERGHERGWTQSRSAPRGEWAPVAGRAARFAAVPLVVAAWVTAPHALAAQDPVTPHASAARADGSQQPTLTLEEALELARRHNPAYRRALNQLEAAGARSRAAWGALLPRLDANLGFSQGFTRTLITQDFFGTPIENPEVRTQVTSSSRQGLSLALTLFEGGSRFHALREARARERAGAFSGEAELARLRADIERRFFETQKANELLEVEGALLAARRDDLEATERRFRLASVQQVEVLAARLAVAQQEMAVQNTRSAARKTMLALRQLIAAPDLPEFVLVPEPVRPLDPSALAADSIVQLALRGSPELRRREVELAAGNAAAAAARARRWPSVTLGASVSRNAFGPDNTALFDLSPQNQSGGVSLGVSLPLFQGFETTYRIAQAEVAAANAGEDVREAALMVERMVRERLTDLESAYRALEIAERAREIAAERLRLERERYRRAASGFLELQEAVRQAAEAERGVVEARYRFVESRIALEETVGGPVVSR